MKRVLFALAFISLFVASAGAQTIRVFPAGVNSVSTEILANQGDIFYVDSSNHNYLTRLAIGAAGQVLQSSGTLPQWVDTTGLAWLTTPVTVANGGMGAGTHTAHGVLFGEGTSNIAAAAAGTAGQFLTSGGASADPGWTTTLPIANGGTNATTFSGAQTSLGFGAIRLAADTATTGQTLVGSPLLFAVGTSQSWEFDGFIQATSSSVAGNKYGVTFPSGCTVLMQVNATDTTATGAQGQYETITASATAGAAHTQLNGTGYVWVHGTILTTSSSGNVVLDFLKATSGTATLKAGSYIKWQRIS